MIRSTIQWAALAVVVMLGGFDLQAADDLTYDARISGMRCEGCRAEVSRLLKELPGVGNVEVGTEGDVKAETVVIHCQGELTSSSVQKALGGENAGFEVSSLKKRS